VLEPRLDGLLDPAAYQPRPAGVELRETHISWVLLAGDRAYKVKKPLTLPFLDYGSLARRRELCRQEAALNARLAPRIYRGVRAIVPAGGGLRVADESDPDAVEYAVEMCRYDEHATLAHRLAQGTANAAVLRAVGARIAGFHAAAAIPEMPERTVPALERMLEENFATLRELGVPSAQVGDAAELAGAFIDGRRAELVARAVHGLVRDGHGDLRAEHVLLERGIEVVDCVEFDPSLRHIDTGLDLGFLMMDVMRHGRALAAALVDGYRAAGGDPGDDALLRFFAAQRALIRAKVALIRAGQVGGADAVRRRSEAVALVALADRLAWEIRLGRLAVICGPAASGKTTLATALAARARAEVLSSDVVRKELLGIRPTSRAPASAYGPEMNRRTYAALGRAAAARLAAGATVLLDGTFRFAADREAFAEALGARDATWIECRAPTAVVARRAGARERGPDRISDADRAIAARTVSELEPLADVAAQRRMAVTATGGPAALVTAVRRALDERLRGSRRDVDEVMLERVADQLGA
jgi:aminoglycoside phosphotransferase family enzyme/predicted kinase